METELGSATLVMVHVPKTAGSSLNAAMEQALGNGLPHIESMPVEDAEALDRLRSASWISGHLPLHRMRKLIEDARLDPVHLITAMREPAAHVASHYNWLIEIGRRTPQFFHGHPDHIKEIHHIIASSDNSDPKVVIANLQRYPRLFLDCQSLYVLGDAVSEPDLDFSSVLQAYDCILTEDTIDEFLLKLGGTSDAGSYRQNASPYHFDKAVFSDPKIIDFLNENNATDNALYRYIKQSHHNG